MIERLLLLIEKYPLNLVSHLCNGLPVLLGLFFIRILPKELKLLILYFALHFIIDSYDLWLAVNRESTFFVENLQPLFDIWIIGFIYFYSSEKSVSQKRILYGLVLCSIIILLSYKQNSISTLGPTIQRLFVMTVVFSYFNQILTDARIRYILFHDMFWVSAGLLLYSVGTFFFSLFNSYLYSVQSTSDEEFDNFWMFNQILYVIFCLMACVGLWASRYEHTNSV